MPTGFNAFGSVKKGSEEIVAYLRGLFADAKFAAGTSPEPPQSSMRRVTDDVVVVSIRQQIYGQGRVGESAIPVRDNHSLHVLQKQADGRWLIVSEMFMDARQDETYTPPPNRRALPA